MNKKQNLITSHTICVLVRNEPGVLARVIGLFSGRGYNIESLTVAEIETTGREERLSRITLVTKCSREVVEQIKAQLERLVPVYRVDELLQGPEGDIECELALIKVDAADAATVETMNARLVDVSDGLAVLELTGPRQIIDRTLNALRSEDSAVKLKDVTRTGIAALTRGAKTLGLE